MKQAFLIGAYKNPDYLVSLIETLVSTDSYVFVHVNAKNVDVFNFVNERFNNYANVEIFSKYKINWGGIGLLNSMLYLMKEALKSEAQFFHFLTGQDILVKPLSELQYFCENNPNKNFVEMKDYCAEWDWRYNSYHLYDYVNSFSKIQMKLEGLFVKIQRVLNIKRKPLQFQELKVGSGWWSLNREALKYIIDVVDKPLINRLKWTFAPDEIIFQSVLYNSYLRDTIVGSNLCYIDWPIKTGSPKILTKDDFDNIKKSNNFFARKIDPIISKELIEKINNTRKQ